MNAATNLSFPNPDRRLNKAKRYAFYKSGSRSYALAWQPLLLLVWLVVPGIRQAHSAPATWSSKSQASLSQTSTPRLASRLFIAPRRPKPISIPVPRTFVAPFITVRKVVPLAPRVAAKRGPGLAKEMLIDRIILPARPRATNPALTWNDARPATVKAPSSKLSLARLPALHPLVPGVPAGGKLPAGLPRMRKIIAVAALAPAPATRPLPDYLRNKAVSADGPFAWPASLPLAASLPLPANHSRLSQNPNLPPLRQPAAPVTSSDRLPNVITVATSTFVVLLTTTDLQTVAVADPGIADVSVVNSRGVLVNGKTAGVTSLVIIDRLKIRQYQVRVTAAFGKSLADITNAIGLSGVIARQAGESLILDGEVANADEKRRAEEIAGAFAAKIINQIAIPAAPAAPVVDVATQAQNAINLPNVKVLLLGETLLLEGTVENLQQSQRAETIAKTFDKKVANLLQTPSLNLDQIREAIGATAPGVAPGILDVLDTTPHISIRQTGDQLILDGRVATAAQSEQAALVAARSGLRVINNLQVAPAASAEYTALRTVEASINRAVPGAAVTVSGTPLRLILMGTVPDTNAAVAAEQIARAYAKEVDNMMRTPKPQIVDVDVSIVEINRNGLRNLGFNFPALQDSSATGFVIGQRSTNPNGADFPGAVGTVNRAIGSVSAFQMQLRAVVESGNARLLSNPHTTVLSSRTATFQVGGQVPVPVSITQTATGTTTGIEFKDFGVLVDVIPSATEDGAVTMRLRTEVSQPDFTIGFTPFPGASEIPGFSRRSTVTEVTVEPNGSIALGGLIQNSVTQLERSIPLLSRLPILGSLFKSKRFQRNETELVIFVTPRVLPNNLKPGQTVLAGVVSAGNTTNVATKLGNPGIRSFDTGNGVTGGVNGNGGGTP